MQVTYSTVWSQCPYSYQLISFHEVALFKNVYRMCTVCLCMVNNDPEADKVAQVGHVKLSQSDS